MKVIALVLSFVWTLGSCGSGDGGGAPDSSAVLEAIDDWESAHRVLADDIAAAMDPVFDGDIGTDVTGDASEVRLAEDIQVLMDSLRQQFAALPHQSSAQGANGFYVRLGSSFGEKLTSLQASLDAEFRFEIGTTDAEKSKTIRERTQLLIEEYGSLGHGDSGAESPGERSGATECAEAAVEAFGRSMVRKRQERAEGCFDIEQARAHLLAAETRLEFLVLRAAPGTAARLLADESLPKFEGSLRDLLALRAGTAVSSDELETAIAQWLSKVDAMVELQAGATAALGVVELELGAMESAGAASAPIECEVLRLDRPVRWDGGVEGPFGSEEMVELRLESWSGLTDQQEQQRLAAEGPAQGDHWLADAMADYRDVKSHILSQLDWYEIRTETRAMPPPSLGGLVSEFERLVSVQQQLVAQNDQATHWIEAGLLELGRLRQLRLDRRTKEFQVRIAAMLQASARAAD